MSATNAPTPSNGDERLLERIRMSAGPTVLMIPLVSSSVLLIRECCAGTNAFEMVFPTGTVESGELRDDSVQRELKEELRFGARRICRLIALRV
jgi:ADP-ribose diphosphatase